MTYFLVNENLPEKIKNNLSAWGMCISLPMFEKLPFPVCAHPDMLMADLDGALFVHREYAAGQRILERLGVPFRLSETPVGIQYPADVALNCFAAGDCLFAKQSAASPQVKEYAAERGFSLVNVSQGYTKCSCAVAKNAIVTADVGIFRAAKARGLRALLIPPAHIDIEVYDTGFLGGASGLLSADTLGFFGDLDAFPAGEDIRAFFAAAGVKVVSLSDEPLFDHGGLIRLHIS